MTKDDWIRLGRAVKARREELGMTQAELQDAGGPSTAKLREIENLRTSTLSTSKRRDLERVLGWETNSVDVVLAGGEPRNTAPAPRAPRGAWELGPQMMVDLAVAADEVEWYLNDAYSIDADTEIEEAASAAHALADAAEQLIERASTVAAYGVGGEAHLRLLVLKQREAEKARRKARLASFRRQFPEKAEIIEALDAAEDTITRAEAQLKTATTGPSGGPRHADQPATPADPPPATPPRTQGTPGEGEKTRAGDKPARLNPEDQGGDLDSDAIPSSTEVDNPRSRTGDPTGYDLVARDVGGPSERELFDARQDAAAEAPDPEGPESGA